MHKQIAIMAVVAILGLSVVASAQPANPALEKLADDYQVAVNKADAKAVAALYTADAWRVGPNGQLITGRAAIEQDYAGAFAGPLKGAKLTLRPGKTQMVTADVALIEGSYELVGGAGGKGRYLNTVKREGSQWLLATVVAIPETAAK